MVKSKKYKFDESSRQVADIAKALSHPARVAILKYLAHTKTCISGDISNEIPLSRTTVSQHLKELRDAGLIHGEIEGLKINYCLCHNNIEKCRKIFTDFLTEIDIDMDCKTEC